MIGDRIRELAKNKDLNDRTFSKKVGVSKSFLKSAKKSIRTDILVKILDTFPDVDVNWLLRGNGVYPPKKHRSEDFPVHEKVHLTINKNNTTGNININGCSNSCEECRKKELYISRLEGQIDILKNLK